MGNKTTFSNQQICELQEKWKPVQYLIIDEISLVSQKLLASIDTNLRLFKTNHDNAPFGSSVCKFFILTFFFFSFFFVDISVIICGDFRQLPPVAARSLFTNPQYTSQIQGNTLYHLFQNVVILDENKRQTDHLFQQGTQHFFSFFFFSLFFLFCSKKV